MLPYSFYQDYWELYHKVTFDGPNKLILVNKDVTELNVKEDIYSDWKEWLQGHDAIVNATFITAVRTVGGDPLPGAQYLGDTYFLTNGWRIKPYQGSYTLTINGNLFTEEGDSPIVDADGTLNNIRIEFTRSQLVQSIEVESTAEVPSATEIASAVWDRLVASHTSTGTFGKEIQDISTDINTIDSDLQTMDGKIDTIDSDLQTIDGKIDTIDSELETMDGKLDTIDGKVDSVDLTQLETDMKRALGLMHENIYIDNTVYDSNDNLTSARVRVYSTSISVGTDSNVIGTYQITSTATGANKFSIWKQVKQ